MKKGFALALILALTLSCCAFATIEEYAHRNSSVTKVDMPDDITEIKEGAYYYCEQLAELKLSNNLVTIGDFAFDHCISLTELTIPDSVTTIGVNAFNYCMRIQNLKLGEGLTSLGDYAFSFCMSLNSVTIPRLVSSIGYMAFYNCRSLTEVYIYDNVETIGERAFEGCPRLTIYTTDQSPAHKYALKNSIPYILIENEKQPLEPELQLRVLFGDATLNGEIKVGISVGNHTTDIIRLNKPRGTGEALRNVRITLTPNEYLEIPSGEYEYWLGDIEFGEVCQLAIPLKSQYGNPAISIRAESDNSNGIEYSCELDTITRARALILGCDRTVENTAIKNDMENLHKLFESGYYDGLPIEVYSEYIDDAENEDFWKIFKNTLSDWDPDDNDITYIYLGAHGIHDVDGSITDLLRLQVNPAKGDVSYQQIYSYLDTNVRGNIVLMFGACFSGLSVAIADTIDTSYSTGLDETKYSIISATGFGTTRMWIYSYTYFANELIGGTKNGIADYNGDGIISVYEIHSYVKERGGRPTLILTQPLETRFYGNPSIPFYTSSAQVFTGRRKLAPINEGYSEIVKR